MRSLCSKSLLAVAMTLGLAGPAMAQEEVRLTVLAEVGAAVQTGLAIGSYADEHPEVQVELILAGNQDELLRLAELLTMVGETPDLIVTDHHLGDYLRDRGLANAYCSPDWGGCEACFGANPPRWCPYAQGISVGPGAIGNFGIHGLCDIDQCPSVCMQVPMPEWCTLIHAPAYELFAPDYGYDVLRASFIERLDGDILMPRGIPWWWRAHVVWANEELGFEAGQTIHVDDLAWMVADLEGLVYLDSTVAFEQMGLEPPHAPNFAKGDPSPQPNVVGLFFGFTDTIRTLDPALQDTLVPLHVEGYRPEIVVSGAYVPGEGAAGRPDVALDLAYTALWLGTQEELGLTTEYLPVHAGALDTVLGALPEGTWDQLARGVPHAGF